MATQSTERLHALDAVRGGALLLGIVLHMSMSFWPVPFWPIRDSQPSPELFTSFLVIHIFRMSLFFLMAGFFARLLFQKRGPLAFAKDRAIRIGVPFVVGWPILFVAFIAAIIWNVMKANGGVMPENSAPPPALTVQTLPLLHTWFLYALLLLYTGALAVVGVFTLIDRKGHVGRAVDAVVHFLVKFQLAPIVVGLPLAAFFFFESTWIASGGVRTPDVGLAPNLMAVVAFSSAFGFGWLLHRQIDLLAVFKRWWPIYLAVAVGLTVLIVKYAGLAANPTFVAEMSLTDKLITSGIYPLAIWTWSFGLVGMALTFLSKENKVVRYLADSSYWLYLIHLPVVMVFQIPFATVDLPWFVKFPIMLALSLAAMLASYQLLVRNTPIGTLLNGRRYGRQAKQSQAPLTTAQPTLS